MYVYCPEGEATLNAGKNLAAMLQTLGASESTLDLLRVHYGGMRYGEANRLKHRMTYGAAASFS